MKFNKWAIGLLGVTIICAVSAARAQTATTNAPANFFQSVEGYLTSANTNYSWANDSFEMSVGADYLSGVNWAAALNAQYDLQSVSQNSFVSHLSIDGDMRNAEIAGTIVAAEGGVQYAFVEYYSVKIYGGINGGYDFQINSAIIEPDFGVRAKMTQNTFAGLRLSLPIFFSGAQNHIVNVRAETGFSYEAIGANGQPVAWRTRMDHARHSFRKLIDPTAL